MSNEWTEANICQEHDHITMARPCPWCRIRELEAEREWWFRVGTDALGPERMMELSKLAQAAKAQAEDR